jgi:hypothetical protein
LLFCVFGEKIRVRVMTTTTTTTQVCMIMFPLRIIFRTVLGILILNFVLFSSFFMLPDVECEIMKNHMLLTHGGKPENPSRVLWETLGLLLHWRKAFFWISSGLKFVIQLRFVTSLG